MQAYSSHSDPAPRARADRAVFILCLGGALTILYTVALSATGMRAELAESNLQSNLMRASDFLGEHSSDIVLVGSSVGGRLLPRYFANGGLEIRNLGLDGSRPLFAFEVVDKRTPLPRLIVVETSTLFQPIMQNDITLRDAIASPGWNFSRFVPAMRPENRPSSLLYSWIKRMRDDRGAGQASDPYFKPDSKATGLEVSPRPNSPGWMPEDQFDDVLRWVKRFRAEGVDVVLLRVPAGSGWGIPASGLARRLADTAGLPLLDPGPAMAAEGKALRFSDGMHLDSASAREVTERIVQELATMGYLADPPTR